jgi:peptidoglycan hydrolase CwlO-like protein
MLAACTTRQDTTAMESTGVDSLAAVREELLNQVVASTGFMNDIHKQLEKARVLTIASTTPSETPSDIKQLNDQRQEVLAGISRLVGRLDSVQGRLTTTRSQFAQLTRKESALIAQVAEYQKNVTELQAAAETQRAELQAIVDRQVTEIATLASRVDTLDRVRVALTDTVGRLTSEKNAAYYVVGTREELIKKGILVAEGQKRFLILGSRNIAPARTLDPASFTKIDRLSDRTIDLPAGEYQILSRQNPEFATAASKKPGRITGPLTIEQPEHFWESSPFLIIVRS